MSLASDLLAQARHLARMDRRRPKQASLRRAISGAYYALFHLLLSRAARQIVVDPRLRGLVSRAFSHGEMQKAAKSFASSNLPDHVKNAVAGRSLPPEIDTIAKAFVNLQQARHEADYNLLASFTRQEVLDHITTVESAFAAWGAITADPKHKFAVELFLSSLLLWDRWGKK